MRVLIVEDDDGLRQTLCEMVSAAGYTVVDAPHGEEALRIHRSAPVGLILTDVNMPFMDGFTLCRTLRDAQDDVPLVMLTSRDSEIDEVLGLELGADDYISKPVSSRLLLSRIRTLLRRSQPKVAPAEETLSYGSLALDRERMEVRLQGELLSLTLTEVRLFEVFLSRPGRVLSRQRLLALGRGEDDGVVAPRIIDTYIGRMRKKLKAIDPDRVWIETVVGVGYRLKESTTA